MQWSQNLCRICGQTSQLCHLIFNKDPDNNLEDKIKKCLKLKLFQDDFKPKQLCNACVLKLNDFHNFVTLCHATDQKFESLLMTRQQWESDDMIIDYTQQKLSVIVTPKSLDQLDCNVIDLYKESVLPLDNCTINEHDMLEIVENATTYSGLNDNLDYMNAPTYGMRKFASGSNFFQESTVLRHSSNYQIQENPSDVAINYSCQQSLHKSLEVAEPAPINYKETFSNIVYNGVNIDYNLSECTNLDKDNGVAVSSYESPAATDKSPSKLVAQSKTFSCPQCDLKFKRRMTLNSHITAIHKKLRPYVCDVCNKSYTIRCDLTTHKKIHSGWHKCKFCALSFTAPSKLQRHVRTHTKDKPFVCTVKDCGRSFSDKRNLDAHKISLHSVELKFTCDECGKGFKSKNRLRQHGKVHSTPTLYTCEVCSKSYKYKCTLILHLKKHSGYICTYCKKDCERVVKLIKHRKICPVRFNKN